MQKVLEIIVKYPKEFGTVSHTLVTNRRAAGRPEARYYYVLSHHVLVLVEVILTHYL